MDAEGSARQGHAPRAA